MCHCCKYVDVCCTLHTTGFANNEKTVPTQAKSEIQPTFELLQFNVHIVWFCISNIPHEWIYDISPIWFYYPPLLYLKYSLVHRHQRAQQQYWIHSGQIINPARLCTWSFWSAVVRILHWIIWESLVNFKYPIATPLFATCVFNKGIEHTMYIKLPLVGIEPPISTDIILGLRFRIYITTKLSQLSQPTVWS